jgi:hypothetical protein
MNIDLSSHTNYALNIIYRSQLQVWRRKKKTSRSYPTDSALTESLVKSFLHKRKVVIPIPVTIICNLFSAVSNKTNFTRLGFRRCTWPEMVLRCVIIRSSHYDSEVGRLSSKLISGVHTPWEDEPHSYCRTDSRGDM